MVCILYWPVGITVFARASLKSRPKYWSSKKILVRLSWPLWFIFGLYVEELTRKSTMIEQWLLYTNWRRTQMHSLIWRPLMVFRVVTACVEMNPLRVPQVWTFRYLDSSRIFRSSEIRFEGIIFIKPYKHFISKFLSFIEINLCMRYYFRSWSTLQLPHAEYKLTVDNFRHHSVFI